jgi:ligand-binding sensor domain-containing protein
LVKRKDAAFPLLGRRCSRATVFECANVMQKLASISLVFQATCSWICAQSLPALEGTIRAFDDAPTPFVVVEAKPLEPAALAARNANRVEASLKSQIVLTDAQGRYRFDQLLPGRYRLRCHGRGVFYYHGDRFVDQAGRLQIDEHKATLIEISETQTAPIQVDFKLPSLWKGVWRSFSTLDGIPSIKIRSMSRDADGMLWVGTDYVLSQFDGSRFSVLPGAPGVTGMACAPNGVMWFMTIHGLYARRDGQLRKVSWNPFDSNLGRRAPNAPMRNLACAVDGTLWIATMKGLFRYAPPPHEPENGTVEEVATFPMPQWNRGELRLDADGAIWLATTEGLARHRPAAAPGASGVTEIFTVRDGLLANEINCLALDAQGRIWMGTPLGACRFDPSLPHESPERIRNLTAREGMLAGNVAAVDVDARGICWFAVRSGGLTRYDGTTLVHHTSDALRDVMVNFMYRDPANNLYVATEQGRLWRYQEDDFTIFTRRDGLDANNVVSVVPDADGQLWAGTWNHAGGGGLMQFVAVREGDGYFVSASGWPSNHAATQMLVDARKTFWVASPGKLFRKQGSAFEVAALIPGIAVGAAVDHAGNIWTASNERGLFCFDGRSVTAHATGDLEGKLVLGVAERTPGEIWATVSQPATQLRKTILRLRDGQASWFGEEEGAFGSVATGCSDISTENALQVCARRMEFPKADLSVCAWRRTAICGARPGPA